MKIKVEFESTKDNNDTQNCRRKGGKHTTKNAPCAWKGNSHTLHLLNGENCAKDDTMFEAMGTVDEMNSTISIMHSLLQEIEHQKKNNHCQTQ